MTFKVGADIEFFLRNRDSAQLVSAHEYLKGTKRKPVPLVNGAVQVDGVCAEINIVPASTQEEFCKNIDSVFSQVQDGLPNGIRPFIAAHGEFQYSYFRRLPITVRRLGCDADFTIFSRHGTRAPIPRIYHGVRTAGGHIHFGWIDDKIDYKSKEHFTLCQKVATSLYSIYGVLESLWDNTTNRHRYYGRLGAFRPKPYGVEYRGLAGTWLGQPRLWPWLYEIGKKTVELTLAGDFPSILCKKPKMEKFSSMEAREHVELVNTQLGFVYPEIRS